MADDLSPQTEVRREVFRSLAPPEEMRDQVIEQTRAALQRNFDGSFSSPGGYRLELVGDIELGNIPDPDDYEKQYDAVSTGRTFGVPAYGRFRVLDKDGNVVTEKRKKLVDIPVPDPNRTFIIDGKRRFLLSQWRRKPGIYTRRTKKDDIVSEFNVDLGTESRVRPFEIKLDRSEDGENTQFRMLYGGSKTVDMWSIAKMLGASEKELESAVGKKVSESVLGSHNDRQYQKDLRKAYKSIFKESAKGKPIKEIESALREEFDGKSYLDPKINELHLGKDYQTVNKNAVLSSFKRMLEVSRGGEPDDRESLATKMFLSPADLIAESVGHPYTVQRYQRGIEGRMRALDRKNVDPKIDLLLRDNLRKSLKNRVKNSDLERTEGITTPLDAMAQSTATTIVGEGAIGSDKAVPDEAKLLNPTGTGFLDLVHSPESARAGVVLHLASRAKAIAGAQGGLKGKDLPTSKLVSPFRKPNGEIVDIDSYEMANKVIGAFDQYEMIDGKLSATPNEQGQVRAFRNGKVTLVSPEEVDYYQKDAQQVFDANVSLVPFLSSTQGNRAGYAAKQMKQSLPLKYREEPLVQVGLEDHDMSVEEALGEEAGARMAPFDGKVVRVEESRAERRIVVKKKGSSKETVIRLPKNLPTGGKTVIDSEVLVKEGDTFKRGDALADSTFTKNGKLASGVNLNVAYMPYLDGTFEDAIVVSERAAKKFTSEHMYKEQLRGKNQVFGLDVYKANARIPLNEEVEAKLDEDGIIKEGETIMPNEPYAVNMHEFQFAEDSYAKKLAKIGAFGSAGKKGMKTGAHAVQRTWDKQVPGVVTRVEKKRDSNGVIKDVKVFIRTEEPLKAGDKIFGRYGNKGIVSHVLPDSEMPRTRDGNSMDVLLSPLGVIGRQNPSQNFETYLGKVAEKSGRPEIVNAWKNESNWDFVKKRLQESGVGDVEDLLDPVTNKIVPNVGHGKQYLLKAKQQVDKKTNARGVGTFRVDQQVSKGKDSAQSIGELGIYGLIAQNARETLRDAQLYKSEDRADVWDALENGKPLPAPDFPAAFSNFLSHLRGAGIEVDEDGKLGTYTLLPQTDAHIKGMAKTGDKENVISNLRGTINAKTGKPDRNGLFDPKIVGDSGSDTRFSRYEMSRRMPNPTFEKAIQDVLSMRPKDYSAIMAGEKGIKTKDGKELYNAQAIEYLLSNTDLDKQYESSLDTLKKLASSTRKNTSAERSRALRTLKTVQMLKKNGMRPDEAFMRKNVLVAPTRVRGLREDPATGDLMIGDLNYLYRDVGLIDHELKRADSKNLPPKAVAELEQGLYDGLRALNQVEGAEPTQGGSSAFRGFLGALAGIPAPARGQKVKADPGESLFKKALLERRQIMSGRAVLAADSKLGLDEVSVPRSVAVSILEPKLIGEWNRSHDGLRASDKNKRRNEFKDELYAYKNEGKRSKVVDQVLDRVTADQYVMVKRDPVLHKYGIQGFKLKLNDSNTLNLNPVVFGGFNADSDGDTLAVYAPIHKRANDEIRQKLLPSKNLFNPSSGQLEFNLSHEAILGISRATRGLKSEKTHAFPSFTKAKDAYLNNQVKMGDKVTIKGITRPFGHHWVDSEMPPGMKLEDLEKKNVISGLGSAQGLGKDEISKAMDYLAKNAPQDFPGVVRGLRMVGEQVSTYDGVSLGMEDLKPIMREERKAAEKTLFDRLKTLDVSDPEERDKAVKGIFSRVLAPLQLRGDERLKEMAIGDNPNVASELTWTKARVKPGQLRQVLFSPAAVTDASGRLTEAPIMNSYTEGLDVTGYVSAAHGVRQGLISKVVSVEEPGYLNKQVVNTAMDLTITENDCGTRDGVTVSIDSKQPMDFEGRLLARGVKVGSRTFLKDTEIDNNVLKNLRTKSKSSSPDNTTTRIKLRSPMTCEAQEGVCQKCAGKEPDGSFPEIGDNIGIKGAQAIGERSTQLMLSLFHDGGVFDPVGHLNPDKGDIKDVYSQASALLRMPSTMYGVKADISKYDGEVEEVKKDEDTGDFQLRLKDFGGKNRSMRLSSTKAAPDGSDFSSFFQPGKQIKKGDVLTTGVASPIEMLKTTGNLSTTRDYMVNKLNGLYGPFGVRRRNIETVVRSITGTVEVTTPSDSGLPPGTRISLNEAKRLKKKHQGFKYRSVIRGVMTAPREVRDDWMSRINYNNIRRSLIESASTGASSNIHSTNPIPALAVAKEFNRFPGTSIARDDGKY